MIMNRKGVVTCLRTKSQNLYIRERTLGGEKMIREEKIGRKQ